MKNARRPVVLVAFIALASVWSAWAVAQRSGKANASYEDRDAYDVYSAVLSMGGQWDDSKTLVVRKDLPPTEWPIGSPQGALQGDAEFRQNFEKIFMSFEGANRQALLLKDHFAVHKPDQLVGLAELQGAFHRSTPSAHSDGCIPTRFPELQRLLNSFRSWFQP
jgi:hypothetical protein